MGKICPFLAFKIKNPMGKLACKCWLEKCSFWDAEKRDCIDRVKDELIAELKDADTQSPQ